MATHLKRERDVYVADSGAFGYMTNYRQNDPAMLGYIVEVMGKNGQIVTGNVFEVGDYAAFAEHIRETALPLDSVTLKYSDKWGENVGKTVTASRREYDDDRHRLMSESGDVVGIRFNPASEAELTALLQQERSRRMQYPLGGQETHLKKISAKLAEARKPPEQAAKGSLGDRLKKGGKKSRAQTPATNTKKSKEIGLDG
jgi:hypothetical protein